MKICVTRRQPPDANPKICVSPNAKPRHQSVEYRLRWVPTQNAGVGDVYFMFLYIFRLRLVPNANPISGGIWAYKYVYMVTVIRSQNFRRGQQVTYVVPDSTSCVTRIRLVGSYITIHALFAYQSSPTPSHFPPLPPPFKIDPRVSGARQPIRN